MCIFSSSLKAIFEGHAVKELWLQSCPVIFVSDVLPKGQNLVSVLC